MTTATCHTIAERKGVVTFKGNPMTLLGPELKAGSKAPDFEATAQDLTPVKLADLQGKTTLINVVTSLDTSICDAQTRRFNEEVTKLHNVQVVTVSMDLPFAQKRWCGAAGITNVKVVSDYRTGSFGRAFGVLMKEVRLLSRAIFLVDAGGTVRYAEYVPEVATHPNYDAALAAAREVAK